VSLKKLIALYIFIAVDDFIEPGFTILCSRPFVFLAISLSLDLLFFAHGLLFSWRYNRHNSCKLW